MEEAVSNYVKVRYTPPSPLPIHCDLTGRSARGLPDMSESAPAASYLATLLTLSILSPFLSYTLGPFRTTDPSGPLTRQLCISDLQPSATRRLRRVVQVRPGGRVSLHGHAIPVTRTDNRSIQRNVARLSAIGD